MKNMASWIEQCEHVVVSVALHPRTPPSATEWDHHIEQLTQGRKVAEQTAKALVGLAITDGGGPNSAQRKQIVHLLPKDTAAYAITDDAIARGLVTALSWFFPRYGAFATRDAALALSRLGLNEFEQLRLCRNMLDQQKSMTKVEAAARVCAATGFVVDAA